MLTARAHTDLPAPVRAFFTEAAANARKLRDLGPARVVECDDAALAALIANDRRLRRLCWRCGDRRLIAPATTGGFGEADNRTLDRGVGVRTMTSYAVVSVLYPNTHPAIIGPLISLPEPSGAGLRFQGRRTQKRR